MQKGINYTKLVFVLLIPFIVWNWSCEKNPAREQLGRMNVNYSRKEFLRRVVDSDYGTVKLFLASGIDPNSRNKEGLTALMCSAYRGDIAMVELLVEHGADVNGSNSGATALNSAAAGLANKEKGDQIEVIRFLVEHGADVNTQGRYSDGLEETALMDAARADNLNIVRFLVEHGANVNAEAMYRRTALMQAAQYASDGVVQFLLDHGADPNVEMEGPGGTALTLAEHMGRPQVIKMLKDAGATK